GNVGQGNASARTVTLIVFSPMFIGRNQGSYGLCDPSGLFLTRFEMNQGDVRRMGIDPVRVAVAHVGRMHAASRGDGSCPSVGDIDDPRRGPEVFLQVYDLRVRGGGEVIPH